MTTSNTLKPNHILEATPHNIRDARKAKKRLSKLVQLLEVETTSIQVRSPEIESIILKARAITKRVTI